ncbi:hypothetical protein B5M42_001715 [Paenibacillus athensensis]|nr:hypothetical protein [Paenibacillus athensensis]MCD1257553.1 hypothetical protein [Paenibacillus athensensis]
MPNNRADKKDNQQNKSSFKEESQTLQPHKADSFPPSLNNISKNEQ